MIVCNGRKLTVKDNNNILSVLLHDVEEDFNGLLAVVTVIGSVVQVVSFVDEQHAAHRLLDHLQVFDVNHRDTKSNKKAYLVTKLRFAPRGHVVI